MVSLLACVLSSVFKTRFRSLQALPEPRVCHMVLSEEDIDNRAVFVIGDVHGCYDEMCDLMNLAEQEAERILFLFVGDLANKGPKPKEVVQYLRWLQRDKRAYSVRGNQDDSSLRQFLNFRDDGSFIPGKKYTWVKEIAPEDGEYLSNLPFTISVPSLLVLIVHAGIIPGKPLESQNLHMLTNMRNVVINEDAFEGGHLVGTSSTKRGEAWAKLWPGPEHVYFGHDARRKLQLEAHATGLDTGCVYGGEITGVFINGCQKRLSVKARKMYRKP